MSDEDVTNLQVRLENVFCTPGDQLADSYSLRGVKARNKKQNVSVRTRRRKVEDDHDGVHAHIEVLQLCFGGGLIHKLQDGAQIANVDASLVQGLSQRGSVHGQSAVVQTVLDLKKPWCAWR